MKILNVTKNISISILLTGLIAPSIFARPSTALQCDPRNFKLGVSLNDNNFMPILKAWTLQKYISYKLPNPGSAANMTSAIIVCGKNVDNCYYKLAPGLSDVVLNTVSNFNNGTCKRIDLTIPQSKGNTKNQSFNLVVSPSLHKTGFTDAMSFYVTFTNPAK